MTMDKSTHVQIRCTPEEKQRWQAALGPRKLSDWLRALANDAVAEAEEADVSVEWTRAHADRRARLAKKKRAKARRAGHDAYVALWTNAYRISTATSTYTALDIDKLDVTDETVRWRFEDLLDDISRARVWQDHTERAIMAKLGRHGVLETIAKLEAVTVENGATPDGAANAQRLAAHLRRRLELQLGR
jgi:hypothetical protein